MQGRVALSLILGFGVTVAGLYGQEVVSAKAGLIHYVEGAVTVDEKPVPTSPGTFPSIKEGSALKTEQGRAEVLLTPNVFLRVDQYSAVRMLGTALTDTRVDFVRGSVIIDALKADGSIPVVLLYGSSQIRFLKPGVYRLDSDTDVLQVYSGEAEVTPVDAKVAKVDNSHLYFFGLGTLTTKFTDGTQDEFYEWARDRFDAIEGENQLAAQTGKDQADLDNPPQPGNDASDPYLGPLPGYNGGLQTGRVWLGGVFDNGLFAPGYAPGYLPVPSFPIFVFVGRPYWGTHRPQWPGRTGSYSATAVRTGVWSVPGYPGWHPRPISPIRGSSGLLGHTGVTGYRPVSPGVSTYRPSIVSHPALGGVHAIGHR
jgi:hypothetical protein